MKINKPKKRKRYSVFFEFNQDSVQAKIQELRKIIADNNTGTGIIANANRQMWGPNGENLSPQVLIETALICAITTLQIKEPKSKP